MKHDHSSRSLNRIITCIHIYVTGGLFPKYYTDVARRGTLSHVKNTLYSVKKPEATLSF